jgi:hypothetical protein
MSLAPSSPSSVSLKLLPRRFSMLSSVSVPNPPPVALPVRRLALTEVEPEGPES